MHVRILKLLALLAFTVFVISSCGQDEEAAEPTQPQQLMAPADPAAPQSAQVHLPLPDLRLLRLPPRLRLPPLDRRRQERPRLPPPPDTPQPASQAAPSATQPSATTFKDNERTNTVRTSQDSVSTFSLDTDRTSFQLALSWARAGHDVEPDSVRSEEWVNAFDYRYERPSRDDSFAIHTDIMPHPLDGAMILARIAFQAPELRDDGRPLNVTLVLDSSGSMAEGNRVEIARAAADSIRRSLRSGDRISIVQFDSDVEHRLTVENQSPDSSDIAWSIGQLAPGGSTNVQAGLNRGIEIADSMRWNNPGAYNYVILMSDGVANVDATNPFAILESARDRDSSNPLRLITIGVGIANYNDQLLEQLAQHGNGWYRYLDDPGQARSLFSRESWLALSIPFADQTRAQITWDPNVVDSWRIVGYENRITADQNFTEARKEFAEIPSGAATTVFYELRPVERLRFGDVVSLGDVELRWVTPVSNDSNRQHAQILAGTTSRPMIRSARSFSSERWSPWPPTDTAACPLRTPHTTYSTTCRY